MPGLAWPALPCHLNNDSNPSSVLGQWKERGEIFSSNFLLFLVDVDIHIYCQQDVMNVSCWPCSCKTQAGSCLYIFSSFLLCISRRTCTIDLSKIVRFINLIFTVPANQRYSDVTRTESQLSQQKGCLLSNFIQSRKCRSIGQKMQRFSF